MTLMHLIHTSRQTPTQDCPGTDNQTWVDYSIGTERVNVCLIERGYVDIGSSVVVHSSIHKDSTK